MLDSNTLNVLIVQVEIYFLNSTKSYVTECTKFYEKRAIFDNNIRKTP